MNIEQFNTLPIEKQVEYINLQLETTSLNKACENLGVSESTVRDRFKRNNYKRSGKRFVNLETTDTTITTEPKELKKKLPPKKVNNLDSIKLLEEKIKALESQLEATNKRIDNIITNKPSNQTEITTETTINTYGSDEVVRSFRVNKGVQQRFKNYCKAHTEYRVSDILSTALEEFLSKRTN